VRRIDIPENARGAPQCIAAEVSRSVLSPRRTQKKKKERLNELTGADWEAEGEQSGGNDCCCAPMSEVDLSCGLQDAESPRRTGAAVRDECLCWLYMCVCVCVCVCVCLEKI